MSYPCAGPLRRSASTTSLVATSATIHSVYRPTTSTIVRIACSLNCVDQHSWLAVDAGTTPKVRAQELRFAWERFVADDEEDPTIVREAISDSWRRSSAAGVDPLGG